MKKKDLIAVMFAASMLLAGCVSMLDGAWDEAARDACERNLDPRERGECLDRVDEYARDRR